MKKRVEKRTESELLKTHPIRSGTDGWYFCTTETSNNAWFVEGVDCWGRKVSAQGSDPDKLISDLEAQVRKLEIPENAT